MLREISRTFNAFGCRHLETAHGLNYYNFSISASKICWKLTLIIMCNYVQWFIIYVWWLDWWILSMLTNCGPRGCTSITIHCYIYITLVRSTVYTDVMWTFLLASMWHSWLFPGRKMQGSVGQNCANSLLGVELPWEPLNLFCRLSTHWWLS